MPLFTKGADKSPVVPEPHQAAMLPHSALTIELLDWAINAVSAVLGTSTVNDLVTKGERQRLRDALRALDALYPTMLRDAPVEGD